jgi:hypothetical protein
MSVHSHAQVPVAVAQWVPTTIDDVKRQALLATLGRFEIQESMGRRIRCLLTGQKKVLVLDNSGSMGRTVVQSSLVSRPVVTRADELVAFVQIALPFLVADAPEGVDVWLLNDADGRAAPTILRHVQTVEQVVPHLLCPRGSTPLVQCLRAVFSAYAGSIAEEGLHVVVATDGEPDNDTDGTPGRKALFNLLRHGSAYRPRPENCIVNFLVCTDDPEDVAFLDQLDATCPRVDVTDDYSTERAQAAAARTLKHPMSAADWVFKALIGAADPSLDAVDETAHSASQDATTKDEPCDCCTIS